MVEGCGGVTLGSELYSKPLVFGMNLVSLPV